LPFHILCWESKPKEMLNILKLFLVSLLMFCPACGCGDEGAEGDAVGEQSHAVQGFTENDYAEHFKELEKKVPGGFFVVLQKPFFVIGNEPEKMVEMQCKNTIKWAVDMIKKDYFDRDPEDIIDIWLFKDKDSYRKYAKEIFGDEPTTPYGYFSEEDNALVMNISTGGGTLVHEIVHPFMHSDFAECPPWFDEGLASLYEQSCEKNGHIQGKTNWRLAGLQEAIRKGVVPFFKRLTSMKRHEFYTQDKGTNYAQARYLCYYMQEKGLLVKFYHEFYENRKKDPTGYRTLKQILGEEDMAAFKQKWEAFVLGLRFP